MLRLQVFPSLCLALLLGASDAAPAQAAEPCVISPVSPDFAAAPGSDRLHAVPDAAAAHTALHGQGLFGGETFYLSHLAVFMGSPEAHPHNFQVLLEVAFEDAEAEADLRADMVKHPDTLYTAVPPPFDQMALVAEPPLRTLPGTAAVRGHFEQGGVPVVEETTLTVERVVHFREFHLGGARLESQHYLLFGRGSDVLLAHLLSAPPDFDQIVSASFEATDVPTEAVGQTVRDLLAAGLYLHLPERANATDTRLKPGESLTCRLDTGTRAEPVTAEITVAREHYCEAGELSALVTTAFNRPLSCSP
jgi:hypothetical protein